MKRTQIPYRGYVVITTGLVNLLGDHKLYRQSMQKDKKIIRKATRFQKKRGNMTQLEARTDGISNTLTTVQKDNLVLEIRTVDDG